MERSSEALRGSWKDPEGQNHRHTHTNLKFLCEKYAQDNRGSTYKIPVGDCTAQDKGPALAYTQLNHITDTPIAKVYMIQKLAADPTGESKLNHFKGQWTYKTS